ncbi:hypothetical protein FACS1894167_14200 [Synergistales bacterium]|nr:hypothetical protein FACS1894167_14200 [Synergistales bacterium]GHV51213.1 hypothetical protein FACS1894216_04810 [Synergistales bacterium]
MTDLVSSISEAQSMAIGAQIGAAVTSKVMNTTADLALDLINQMLGKEGIGTKLNTVG